MRRNVDLPQPDGPISAVTFDFSMVSVTPSRTRRPLNQAHTPSASIWPASPDRLVPRLRPRPLTSSGTGGGGVVAYVVIRGHFRSGSAGRYGPACRPRW